MPRSYVISMQQLVIATYIILFLTGLESLLVFTIVDSHRRRIRCTSTSQGKNLSGPDCYAGRCRPSAVFH